MDSITNFFTYLGIYNLLGVILLCFLTSERIGNSILKNSFQILSAPYSIGIHGSLWLIWAIILNLFFAGLNLLASTRWDDVAKFDLLIADLTVYIIFFVLSIWALFSPKYSKGVWANFPIFGFWILWATYNISLISN